MACRLPSLGSRMGSCTLCRQWASIADPTPQAGTATPHAAETACRLRNDMGDFHKSAMSTAGFT